MTCNNYKSYIINFTLSIIMALLLISCSSTTETKTGNLSGTVILNNDTGNSVLDPADYSGVTVALYRPAVLDTTLVRINSEYPNIGVQINQQTEFDHRLQTPVKTATTNADGSFNISKIPAGEYNLVVLKDGWGVRYLFDLSIAEGDNTLTAKNFQLDKSAIELHPETVLSGIIMEPIIFAPYHVYRFTQNTTLTGTVEFNENALLILDNGVQVDIYGEVSCNAINAYFRITSATGIYSAGTQSALEQFYQIHFVNQTNPVVVSKMIFEHSVSGLQFDNAEVTITNSIIRDNSHIAAALFCNTSLISDCVFQNNADEGIMAYYSTQIERCIFLNNYYNCLITEAVSLVQNNYFIDNYLGLRPVYGNNEISYNCFDRNTVAISLGASSPLIARNNFYDNEIDIEMNQNWTQQSFDYCDPSIQYNNFMGDGLYISLFGNHAVHADNPILLPGAIGNKIYPRNYFIASDLTLHIYDANHPLVSPDYIYTVSVIPRSYSQISPSGIQN